MFHFFRFWYKIKLKVIHLNTIYKFESETMLAGETISVRRDIASTGYKKHWHNYYEITVYIGCNGVCNLNGKDYEIKNNCLFLLTPKDFHQIILNKNENSMTFVISFTENAVDDDIVGKLTENALAMYNLSDFIVKLTNHLWNTFNDDERYRKQHIKHLFNSLLIELLQNGTTVERGDFELNNAVRSAISYILTNPMKDLSLEFMARYVGFSTAYFSTVFKESTGIAYKKYVTTIRIEHAKRLLEDGKLSVLEVGLECGFNTPSQFIRMFKNIVGDTPSGYRKKQKNNF